MWTIRARTKQEIANDARKLADNLSEYLNHARLRAYEENLLIEMLHLLREISRIH